MATKKPGSVPKTTRARGSGIPAGGTGWGGPARGASTSKHPEAQRPPKGPGPGRGKFVYSLQGETRLERESRQAEEAREFYYTIMHHPDEATPNRLNAATKLLDRIEGLPVQKIVQAQQDSLDRLTYEQKQAELAAVRAKREARNLE